jgi:ABC-type uncharacterized transport system permease subunit
MLRRNSGCSINDGCNYPNYIFDWYEYYLENLGYTDDCRKLYNFLIYVGPIWPLSGMPSIIQHIAYLMPGTLSSEAFRAIVMKGWGFSHFHVWTGFVSLFGWICFYWIANIWIHRYSLAKQ